MHDKHTKPTPPMGNTDELASKILDLPEDYQLTVIKIISAMAAKDYDALRELANDLPDESRHALLAHISEVQP